MFSVGGLPTLAFSLAASDEICPLCGGKLVVVGSMRDDRSQPSVNIEVWNRAVDATTLISADDPICTLCFHAFRKADQRWVRASENPQSFWRPLSGAVLAFPVPDRSMRKSAVVYRQAFAGRSGKGGYSDAVSYWYAVAAADFRGRIRAYGERLHLYSSPRLTGQEYVEATYGAATAPS